MHISVIERNSSVCSVIKKCEICAFTSVNGVFAFL